MPLRHATYILFYGLFACFLCGCLPEGTSSQTYPVIEISCSTPYTNITREDSPCEVCIRKGLDTLVQSSGTIHLRGNSTAQEPKKPFRLKFNKKKAIDTMPAAKSWVLLANYLDKTMLRNALAFYLSKDSRLEWTPRSRFVELFFNGVAYGTYQLCEKVQVNTNRVNVSSNGWLIEVDARATEDEPQFHTPHMGCPFRVEWPEDDDLTDDRFAQIKAQFQQAEQALYADNFTDPEHGWRKYFDEASVVDWFLVNEIAKNNDAAFFSSCYMHGELDGKIVFGPVWDFDIAFGNDYWEDSQIDSPEGWHVRTTEWYWRFFQDPSFVAAVQEQFKHYYSHRAEYNEYLGSLAAEMAPSAQTNENIWHSMNVKFWNTPVVYGSYEAEVEALIKWFDARMEWMNENIFL